ncbi:hypothetical protein GGX14DRAFT_362959 [Mycena pura]|uniref:Uncharacterized protein n=1 Tax=Mycena pura TaxID=153505 RepID=A0AAD6YCA6_9AGAR|nr:hypothetical protein GGX14DRAFT_362959 [Mycena pura]
MAWDVSAHCPTLNATHTDAGRLSLSIPILDAQRRVIALLGGRPRGDAWDRDVADEAEAAMRKLQPKIRLSKAKLRHRRAQTQFAAIACGVSHGGGQLEPAEISVGAANRRVTDALLAHVAFTRIVGFTAALFALWAPNLCNYYLSTRAALGSWKPTMRWNFPSSPFAACTWNFCAAVCTLHLDFANLAWGWCAITALGKFNPDRGGHLILWDLKLVIRFPPGSTIFIPSALLRHSNTGIQRGEQRSSFVQYTADGLFRWVDNEFMTNDDFDATASPEDHSARAGRARERWQTGLNMFSIVDDL